MTTSIARQSVIIKCNMQKSYLIGNYEFFYAAGFAARLLDIKIEDDIKPAELSEALKTAAAKTATESEDERARYLFQLVSTYIPEESYDDQMKELLLWGKGENNPWMVNLP